jgi:hypothetical protein
MKRVAYIALLLAASGCTVKDHVVRSFATNSTKIYNGILSIKDSDALVASYEMVTGVSRSTASVADEIRSFRDFISAKGSAQETNTESLRASIAIAGAFCKELVNKDSLLAADQRLVFKEVNFSADPTALNDDMRKMVFDRLITRAWYRSATLTEMQNILATLKDAEADTDTGPAKTKNILVIGCTGILAAPDALRN